LPENLKLSKVHPSCFLAVIALILMAVIAVQFRILFLQPIFTLVLTIFLPGFAVTQALFSQGELQAPERAAISLTLSLAITSLSGLFLTITHIGVQPPTILLSISGLTIIFALASVRKQRNSFSLKPESEESSFRAKLSSLMRHHLFLIAVLLFTIAIRLVSFYFISPDYSTADPELLIVCDVADGRLLENYTSLWHYLGLAPYSYPILFHLLLAEIKILGDITLSSLPLINAAFSLIPILFMYSLVKRVFKDGNADISAFILSTSPIFIFETLSGTFKARALAYALICAQLYFAIRILQGKKRMIPLFLLFILASSLTYRVALPINALLIASLLATHLLMKSRVAPHLAGVGVATLGIASYVIAYQSYGETVVAVETLLSSLAKAGPLLLLGVVGILCEMNRRPPHIWGGIGMSISLNLRLERASKYFLAIPALTSLALGLVNWKAADTVPLFLAPLSGIGLLHLRTALPKTIPKPKLDRSIFATLLLIGLLATSFSLSYYPSKWYQKRPPELYDEIEQVKDLLTSRTQRGALILGTGYTGISIAKAFSGIVLIGPEQEPFVQAYALNLLATTNFKPGYVQAWRYRPGSIYEASQQFYRSFFIHNGKNLEQLLRGYFIQYVVTENLEETNTWATTNQQYLRKIFSTPNYILYEVSATEPEMNLLKFIEESAVDGKLLSPYYASPFIAQLGEDLLMEDLNSILDFNYFLQYERYKGEQIPYQTIQELKSSVEGMQKAYENPSKLVSFALERGCRYIILDPFHSEMREKLLRMGQRLLFSQEDVSLFEIVSRTTDYPRILTIKAFDTRKMSNVHATIKIATVDGELIEQKETDSNGVANFTLTLGTYSITAATDAEETSQVVRLTDDVDVTIFLGPPEPHILTVKVIDSMNEEPVSNASVAVRFLNGTLQTEEFTDENGIVRVPLGTMTYNVTATYANASRSQAVEIGSDDSITITLQSFAVAVYAGVYQETHPGVASVQILRQGAVTRFAYTGIPGTVVFNLQPGTYLVIVTLGDRTIRQVMTVSYYTFLPVVFY